MKKKPEHRPYAARPGDLVLAQHAWSSWDMDPDSVYHGYVSDKPMVGIVVWTCAVPVPSTATRLLVLTPGFGLAWTYTSMVDVLRVHT